jgi:hypothetical protein
MEKTNRMRRRELIKALVPALLAPTLTINGMTKAAAAALPKGHYMLFVDARAMDIIPLRLFGDQTIQDAVAIYKADGE